MFLKELLWSLNLDHLGINTIRVYMPIDEVSVLDKIAAAGIKVITSFGYNQEGRYDMVTGSYLEYVNKYKLIW